MTSRPRLRLAGLAGSLVVLIVLLHLAADLDLRGPTGLGRAQLDEWIADPTRVAGTIVRWLALGLSYYLLAVVLIVGGAGDDVRRATGWRRLIPARLGASIGVVLGVTAVAVPFAHHVVSSRTPPAVSSESRLELALVEAPLRLSPVDPAADPSPRTDRPNQGSAEPNLTWEVETGDHMWSISEETLAEFWGRPDVTESQVATYWRTVIAANEHLLVEPGNPDLILPGQVIILPPPPPDPSR